MEISRVEQESRRSPMHLGMIFFLISEAFLFGSLFTTYYYLRTTTPNWPTEHPSAVLASINTFFLLSSSLTVWWAGWSIRRGNESGLLWGLIATVLLGCTFLGITVWEWVHEAFTPWSHAYGSIFYTLTGFHALHVLGGIMLMLALMARTLRHRFSPGRSLAVEIGSLYWHFVDLVWIVVFISIFVVR